MITNISCICQGTSIIRFAKKAPHNCGEHGEFIRPSIYDEHNAKTENTHIFVNIGDHQACYGDY